MSAEALGRLISDHFEDAAPLGVAVSGGGDSLALLHLLHGWGGAPLRAVTVDHGLREASAGEALQVASACAALGVPHDTLRWDGWDGTGNLPARARDARYALMHDWAVGHGLGGLALGHTAEDQAETLLMRLARRAGVDGLSGMAARRDTGGVMLHRPLLAARREALRDYLRALGAEWVEDPSNTDGAYRRVQARRALVALAPLGLGVEALCDVAGHMREARRSLGHYAAQEAGRLITVQGGDVIVEQPGFAALHHDIARRIAGAALRWITGAQYGPRGAEMDRALVQMGAGKSFTLAGCRIIAGASLRITREFAGAARAAPVAGGLWDNRWQVSAAPEGAMWRALGPEGRSLADGWRDSGLPAASVEAMPGLWRGAELLASPVAGLGPKHAAELRRTAPELPLMIKSH